MAQDLRELAKEIAKDEKPQLPKDHQIRFEALLDRQVLVEGKENGIGKSNKLWLKIAAVLVVALGVTWFFRKQQYSESNQPSFVNQEDTKNEHKPAVLLSDISPDFKRVEDYYTASIKLELARLDITDDNQGLIDSFMQQLERLDAEYKLLNQEIVQEGINEVTVTAMIDNLKLRLELLLKLKSKLKQLKAEAKELTV